MMESLQQTLKKGRRIELATAIIFLASALAVVGAIAGVEKLVARRTQDRVTLEQTERAIRQLVERNGLVPPDPIAEPGGDG